MTQPIIVAAATVRSYFKEAIDSVVAKHAQRPEKVTTAYLVDLLCQYVGSKHEKLDQPLVTVLAQAEQKLTAKSIDRLKQVGDQSLYTAGYFADSLKRSDLDQGYYIILGGTAYRRLGRLLSIQGTSAKLVVVFNELGEEFPRFVEVLEEVRKHDAAHG